MDLREFFVDSFRLVISLLLKCFILRFFCIKYGDRVHY